MSRVALVKLGERLRDYGMDGCEASLSVSETLALADLIDTIRAAQPTSGLMRAMTADEAAAYKELKQRRYTKLSAQPTSEGEPDRCDCGKSMEACAATEDCSGQSMPATSAGEEAIDAVISRAYNQGCMHIQGDSVAAEGWRVRCNESRAALLAAIEADKAALRDELKRERKQGVCIHCHDHDVAKDHWTRCASHPAHVALAAMRERAEAAERELADQVHFRNHWHDEWRKVCADRDSIAAQLAEANEVLRSIRDNFDHDEDAHRYGTECRCCAAAAALKGSK